VIDSKKEKESKTMFGLTRKKTIIKVFAKELARLQKRADKYYYIDNDQDMSSYMLDRVIPLKDLTNKLGITNKVYDEAYKIYDFRNSGEKDYSPDLEELRIM
jgi:predicted MPP superfamily phosphohydrolase